MKRHHVVAVFLLIYGGLFVYLRLDDGETERAIRMGIFFTLLGIFAFFFGKLEPRLRSLGVTLILLIVLGVSTYGDFIAGDIVSVIIQGVLMSALMILAVAPTLCQDKPFYKEKIEPYIGIIALLIMTLFLLFDAFPSL